MTSATTPTPPPSYTIPPPSDSQSENEPPRTPRSKRPGAPARISSSMIVPSNHPEIEAKTPKEFPPDDARAMSPRQSNDNLAAICSESREKIQNSTIEHQSSLAALVEKIETVKTGHEKLERDNNALQEYIGGLTRSMSKTDLARGSKK